MSEEKKEETTEEIREASDREAFQKFVTDKVEAAEAPDEPEADDEQPEASDEAPGGRDDGKDGEPEDAEVQKAKEFLRLKSFPQEAIDSADKNTILQWRDGVREREANVSRTFEELADTKRELEDLRKQLSETQAASEAEPAVPAAKLDLEGVKARLKESLGEEEGDVLGDALSEVLAPLQQTMNDQARRLAEQERIMSEARERNEVYIKAANRERLSQRLPQLQDDDVWGDFQAAVESRLARNGKSYSTVEDLYDATARGIYGADALEDQVEEEPKTDVSSSTPTPPGRKKQVANIQDKIRDSRGDPVKQAKLKLAADRAAFDHLQKRAGDVRGAQRAQGIKV